MANQRRAAPAAPVNDQQFALGTFLRVLIFAVFVALSILPSAPAQRLGPTAAELDVVLRKPEGWDAMIGPHGELIPLTPESGTPSPYGAATPMRTQNADIDADCVPFAVRPLVPGEVFVFADLSSVTYDGLVLIATPYGAAYIRAPARARPHAARAARAR